MMLDDGRDDAAGHQQVGNYYAKCHIRIYDITRTRKRLAFLHRGRGIQSRGRGMARGTWPRVGHGFASCFITWRHRWPETRRRRRRWLRIAGRPVGSDGPVSCWSWRRRRGSRNLLSSSTPRPSRSPWSLPSWVWNALSPTAEPQTQQQPQQQLQKAAPTAAPKAAPTAATDAYPNLTATGACERRCGTAVGVRYTLVCRPPSQKNIYDDRLPIAVEFCGCGSATDSAGMANRLSTVLWCSKVRRPSIKPIGRLCCATATVWTCVVQTKAVDDVTGIGTVRVHRKYHRTAPYILFVIVRQSIKIWQKVVYNRLLRDKRTYSSLYHWHFFLWIKILTSLQ